jgi:predicted  nucleic acid-binding Zn-ribbon protein
MAPAFSMRVAVVAAFMCAAAGVKTQSRVSMTNRANPIRRVVDLLQKMQKQVEEEGKLEEELYNKFMCYCTTGKDQLVSSIASAEEKVDKVTASLEEAESRKAQFDSDIKKHKQDRKDAKDALEKAIALRQKEANAYAKASGEMKTNLSAMTQAIAAISKGMEGAFLQSKVANALRRLTVDAEMGSDDRQAMTAFLSQGQTGSSDYAPNSGQILGILKQMKATMEQELQDATAAEEKSIKDFESLEAAKKAEIDALTAAIEQELEASGQLGVEIVDMKEDIDDTTKSLAEDKKFLAEIEKSCGTKKAEWEERSKLRTQELLAIADTIKILNDDDSLELFKKTLPSPTLIQMKVTSKEMRKAAREALRSVKGGDRRVALIAMMLQGGKPSFEKVIKMIDEMVKLLGKEQEADDDKKTYCEKELDTAEDEKKVLEVKLSDLDKTIDDMKETIATLTDEIAALLKGIKDLDQSVKEATANREEENAAYKKLMQEDSAAKEILKMAKNRLAKFYAPKLYKPPAEAKTDAVGKISKDFGGPALNQQQANPGPPPETWGAYVKMGEESGGVVAMIDILISDLDKEMTAADTEEKDAQKEYEEYVADAAAKRTADSKAVTDKEGEKSELEASLTQAKQERKGTVKDLYIKETLIKDLHVECDWLIDNFEVRKAARASEVDSLEKAKAILSGADYSLVQMGTSHRLLRGLR